MRKGGDGNDGEKGAAGADGAKGNDGTAGYNTATVTLYARGATAPALPYTSARTYRFSTATLEGALANEWSQSVPTLTTDPCWIITAVAYSNSDTDSITAAKWSAPAKMTEGEISIGGVNLLRDYKNIKVSPNITPTLDVPTGYKYIRIQNTSSHHGLLNEITDATALNSEVVVSILCRGTRLLILAKGGYKEVPITGQWSVCRVVVSGLHYTDSFGILNFFVGTGLENWADIAAVQIEFGNKGTTMQASPEDVQNNINSAVDNIQIGGVNLLRDTLNPSTKFWTWSSQWNIWTQSVKLDPSKQCTISGNYNEGNRVNVYSGENTFIGSVGSPLPSPYTFTGATRAEFIFVSLNEINTRKPKIEFGNKPTDWSANPQDYTDSIQIGGVNLLRNYDGSGDLEYWRQANHYTTVSQKNIDGKSYINVVGSVYNSYARQIISLKPNTEYVLSVDVAEAVGSTIYIYRITGGTVEYVAKTISTGLHSFTFKTSDTPNDTVFISFQGNSTSGFVTTARIQLEQGNKPTSMAPAPEDDKARVDGVAAMFDGMTAEQVAEIMKATDNQPFMINSKGYVIMKDAFVQRLAAMEAFINTLVSETAFIKALTVQSLSTQGGNIQLDDTIAKLGSAYIDKAGNYNIKESPTGKPVVSLKREDITKLDDLGGNTPSAETATATLTHIGTIARQQLGASLNVGKDNSTMSVTGTISASARRNSNERSVSSTGVIMLYRVNGSTETLCATIGSVTAVAGGSGVGDESIVINEQLTVSAGTYKLYVATTVNKFSTQDSGSAAFAAKMRFEFTATPLITEIGRNGLCVMGNSANYLHAQYDRTTAALTVKGKGTFDLPGALIGGSILASGVKKDDGWGKYFQSGKVSNGRYKITHDLGHLKYYVTATPITKTGWAKVHPGIIEKQANYVLIGIYDAGSDSNTTDYDFDFIICGQN